ncbi:hypothetical protein SEUCBS139899_010580 [Sporothrix eucalyptigena]|uniref:Ribosomal protein bL31m N-terminal domain-containing protein n=1 Tax=Sporothrix eucalyptigena TaxID=1812306 RepID=A0ABP0CAB6_9PEZI
MASVLCERRLCGSALSLMFPTPRIQNTLVSRTTHSLSSAARPRAALCLCPPLPSGRRALSTTASLQARLIQRPQRPYQFTQLVQLSDGSTFTVRTTNPHPLHRCSKDSRNHMMWQPSEKSLRNVEVDEAGRLAAFRSRFGRAWDSAADAESDGTNTAQAGVGKQASGSSTPSASESSDALADLLSGYAAKEEPTKRGGLSAKEQAKKDKKKK